MVGGVEFNCPILVVDDDPEIVRLVRAYLEQAGFKVLTASNGEMALHALRHDRPALVVLDLMLPDRSGWDITRLVRGDSILKDTCIIMLTARVEDTDKIVGLELGADDYISKPFTPREVVARVRSVLRRKNGGGSTAEAEVYQCGVLLLDTARREVLNDGHSINLTPTEFSLLQVMMRNPGYAFSRAELVQVALGYDYEGLERTLDSHIKNLRKKIEPDGQDPVYIQTVYGIGYRLVGPTE
jgi:two-component system alkaline phosphatase synthesis response regulator PhoP